MLKNLLTVARVALTVAGIVIIVDCVSLMIVGKINFGTVVPCLLGAVFVAHGVFWSTIRRYLAQNRWLSRLWYALWGVFILWLMSFGIFIWS